MSAPPEVFVYYHYAPSTAAAIIFVVLFGSTALLHIWQLIRNRTWYFIPFVIGTLFETVGYIGRLLSARETYGKWTLGPYVMQTLLILLAPAFFAASIYMILGRIIRLTDGEQHSPIRAAWLTKVFVAGDVLSFLMQSAGGGIQASATTAATAKTAQDVIMAGLVVQILFFGFFIVVTAVFHYRITRAHGGEIASEVPWQQYLIIMYIASTFIMIRSVFRVIEYAQGQNGYLLTTELFVYVFDGTLMFIVVVMFNIRHPSAIIHGKGHNYQSPLTVQSIEEVPMESRGLTANKHKGKRARREYV